MRTTLVLSEQDLSIDQLKDVQPGKTLVSVDDNLRRKIQSCRAFLERRIVETSRPLYGINTGFGSLCNTSIDAENLEALQVNLVRSHASGIGPKIPREIAALALLLKIRNLAFGYSGVRTQLVDRLSAWYNLGSIPVMYELGSLGASGDLAPLAHMSLPLLGEGHFYSEDGFGKIKASEVNQRNKWSKFVLGAKEGLALLNGTQFSTAFLTWSCIQLDQLLRLANLNTALSYEAYQCDTAPLFEGLHTIRRQEGQLVSAREIESWLSGSDLAQRERYSVQDPYSMRCAPVVHGASWQALKHCREIANAEINSVTDNPNIFEVEDRVISGGNFHAQPIALALDYLAIASAEIASISERRTYLLVNGDRDLPSYLTSSSGLTSGMMIAQYTAASIVSQNKQLCTPASVDSIPSSQGQEDHVSMAANAGTRMLRLMENIRSVLAIEFMVAAQALEYRKDIRMSEKLHSVITNYRNVVPTLTSDRVLHGDIESTMQFMRNL